MGVSVLRNPLSRERWAKRITDAWQKQVPSIFEVGTLLEGAKAELKHGEWMIMVKSELPFGQSTANKLMKVAACDHLRKSDHGPNLPAHWRTLFELTTLTEEQFERGIESGVINSKMQRKDVKVLRGDEEKTEIVKPSQPKVKDFDELCGDFALDIGRTAKDMAKEQRNEFLVFLREVITSLLEKETQHG